MSGPCSVSLGFPVECSLGFPVERLLIERALPFELVCTRRSRRPRPASSSTAGALTPFTRPPPRMRSAAVPPGTVPPPSPRGRSGFPCRVWRSSVSGPSLLKGAGLVVWFPRRAVCVRAAPRGAWCIQRSGFVLLSSSRWFSVAPRRVLAWRLPPEGGVRCCAGSALCLSTVSGVCLE